MKRIWSLFAVLALLCALTIPALAAASGAADAEPAAQTVSEEELARSEENTTKVRKIWAVAALIGVACFGGALGMAHSVAKAANNMAEQPEAAGQIRTSNSYSLAAQVLEAGGEPPVKLHCQPVGNPLDWSVKLTGMPG